MLSSPAQEGIQRHFDPGLGIEIGTKQKRADIDQVRIVPRGSCYVVEVVYRKAIEQADVDPHLVAALDLGVNVLAAATSTKVGFSPLLINGRPLKSINQQYNRQRAHHQSQLSLQNRFTSRQLDRMTTKRNRRVIEMLTYKAELVGIKVIIREESYTSKASFLDLDPIPTYERALAGTHQFSGSRAGRWYRSQHGRRVHSDTNGSYNILRKAVPTAFEAGVEGFAVIPRQLAIFK
jgi:putative transposase